MRLNYSIIITGLLFLSCSQSKYSELPEFQVDINQDISLPLSEIAEEITVIEPELSNESLIGLGEAGIAIKRMLSSENHIIIAMGGLDMPNTVFVFNKDGKFVRSIGSRGQGPGEYNLIQNIAFDDRNSRLFILSWGPNKIICYHLDGTFIKESLLSD